ncbi:MAG: hypothetical protein JSW11_10010 [Candidatus Heimdallarchaeota archaeon]|nr:MAG: hypothetical protein JSW11_10010 [Candidatus Heimdallarchaeota archaeon]
MAQPKVDFDQIKLLLLTRSPQDISEFIRSKQSEEEAMFLFWALDYLEQHPKEISKESESTLRSNRELLEQVQEVIFRENLEVCLKEFSAGFVLGALEFAIREREAQIDRYDEYVKLVAKIEAWPEIRFPNEQFKKHWEERVNDIREIQDWMKQRAKDWYPVIIPLYRSGKFQKSEKMALKALRKGRKDNTVFQILAALLHSNPILDQQLTKFCEKNQIKKVEKAHLLETIGLLARETTDEKVKAYCNLLLSSKKKRRQ